MKFSHTTIVSPLTLVTVGLTLGFPRAAMSEKLTCGEYFIEQGLQSSRMLVLVMSLVAFASEWCAFERRAALFKIPPTSTEDSYDFDSTSVKSGTHTGSLPVSNRHVISGWTKKIKYSYSLPVNPTRK